MPLASLVHWLSSTPASSTLSTLAFWGSLVTLVVGLRAWSKGYVCKEERGLAGKSFLLTGAFEGSQNATDVLPGRGLSSCFSCNPPSSSPANSPRSPSSPPSTQVAPVLLHCTYRTPAHTVRPSEQCVDRARRPRPRPPVLSSHRPLLLGCASCGG
ncbi:hypothetical protein AAT19DRAFT_9650 [Rhodotorula toruloides]|uniref:Uncharacterized protein n=1 Tax=Rhodotorula toruloides TaxID=5286 RepID=A0A2T0A2U1_RHOTO|nr:hypothetical protein AAT19DRAFT_9650 [Rhodotorula toruloides]